MFPLYFATYSSAVLDPVITKSLQCSYVSIFFLTPLLLPVSTAYLLQTVARLNTHINQAFNLWVQNVFYVPFILSLLLSSIPLKREGERDGDKAVIQRERREWWWRLRENQGWQNKRKKAREDETQRSRENDSFYCVSVLICVHSVRQRGRHDEEMSRWSCCLIVNSSPAQRGSHPNSFLLLRE